ncbi:hypothetical protein HZA57_06910, partial [Candidatus Poribacteria bacterium]|nr:hypothetical protein [Candidatus Poribacteria bacterium]
MPQWRIFKRKRVPLPPSAQLARGLALICFSLAVIWPMAKIAILFDTNGVGTNRNAFGEESGGRTYESPLIEDAPEEPEPEVLEPANHPYHELARAGFADLEDFEFLPPSRAGEPPVLAVLTGTAVHQLDIAGTTRTYPLPHAFDWAPDPRLGVFRARDGTLRLVAAALDPPRAVCMTTRGGIVWERAFPDADSPTFDSPRVSVRIARDGAWRIFLHSPSAWGIECLDEDGKSVWRYDDGVYDIVWSPLRGEDWPGHDVMLIMPGGSRRVLAMSNPGAMPEVVEELSPPGTKQGWLGMSVWGMIDLVSAPKDLAFAIPPFSPKAELLDDIQPQTAFGANGARWGRLPRHAELRQGPAGDLAEVLDPNGNRTGDVFYADLDGHFVLSSEAGVDV